MVDHVPMEYTESFFPERHKIHYTLSSDTLSVTEGKANATVQLRGLEPEYGIERRRSPGFYVGVVGLAVALVLEVLMAAEVPVAGLVEHPRVLAMIIWALSLLCVVTSFRKVEIAVFRSTMGLDALFIARSGPDSSKFHNFVAELSRRIRQVQDVEG